MTGMPQRYIVTYDVCEAKRLRKVFKVLKGFGKHIQYSVFRCDLARIDLVRLTVALQEVINAKEDQVLFIDIGPADGRSIEAVQSLGRTYSVQENGPVIV